MSLWDCIKSVREEVETETSDVEFEQYLWGEDLEGLRTLGNSPRMEVWRSKLSPSQQQILQTVLKRKELGEAKVKEAGDMSSSKMSVIVNIQQLQKKIGDTALSFEELETKSEDELRKLQDDLIPAYNDSVRGNNG